MPTPFREEEGNTTTALIASGLPVLRSLRTRARRETTCTRTGRSPARLGRVIKTGPRSHEPNGGHERTGEVGLCRSTSEPAEQRRAAAFGGGREGREQTEENIVQSHMRPTQSGQRMSQGLHSTR